MSPKYKKTLEAELKEAKERVSSLEREIEFFDVEQITHKEIERLYDICEPYDAEFLLLHMRGKLANGPITDKDFATLKECNRRTAGKLEDEFSKSIEERRYPLLSSALRNELTKDIRLDVGNEMSDKLEYDGMMKEFDLLIKKAQKSGLL